MNRENPDNGQLWEKCNKTSSTASQRKEHKKHQQRSFVTQNSGILRKIPSQRRERKSAAPALNKHIQASLASEV